MPANAFSFTGSSQAIQRASWNGGASSSPGNRFFLGNTNNDFVGDITLTSGRRLGSRRSGSFFSSEPNVRF